MRIVLDTNCVISGLFWGGPAHELLDLAFAKRIRIYTSDVLASELLSVLNRPKFAAAMKQTNRSADAILASYLSIAYLIKRPQAIQPVCRDPSDDEGSLAHVPRKQI